MDGSAERRRALRAGFSWRYGTIDIEQHGTSDAAAAQQPSQISGVAAVEQPVVNNGTGRASVSRWPSMGPRRVPQLHPWAPLWCPNASPLCGYHGTPSAVAPIGLRQQLSWAVPAV